MSEREETTVEWQEYRYSEVLEHPTWHRSTEKLAKRHFQQAKARKIRSRVVTRSPWKVED